MSDEFEALELEAARLKVQRERLALQREIESHRRFEKAAQVSSAVVSTAQSAGSGLWAIFMFCFVAMAGALIGIVALCVWALYGANVNAQHIAGEFTYRFGHLMGSIPEWVYLIAALVGAAWALVQRYRIN